MTIVAVNSGMRAELKFARNNAVLTRRREITWFICIRFERKFPRIRNEKRVKETFFADRYFSRSFLFSHPIISARRKVDSGKKERKRKETGPRFTARLPLLRPPLSQSHSILRVSTSVSTGDIDYWMSEWLNASVRCNDSGPTAERSWSRLYRSTGLWAFCVL